MHAFLKTHRLRVPCVVTTPDALPWSYPRALYSCGLCRDCNCRAVLNLPRATVSSISSRTRLTRDLKPENVLIRDLGFGDAEVKITDFGLSRDLDDVTGRAMTSTNCVRGTPSYMSPEQWRRGRVTDKADVYAYGLILLELFSGEPLTWEGLPREFVDVSGREQAKRQWYKWLRRSCLEGHRPVLPERPSRDGEPVNDTGFPTVVGDIVVAALAAEPEARPTFDAIVDQLRCACDDFTALRDAAEAEEHARHFGGGDCAGVAGGGGGVLTPRVGLTAAGGHGSGNGIGIGNGNSNCNGNGNGGSGGFGGGHFTSPSPRFASTPTPSGRLRKNARRPTGGLTPVEEEPAGRGGKHHVAVSGSATTPRVASMQVRTSTASPTAAKSTCPPAPPPPSSTFSSSFSSSLSLGLTVSVLPSGGGALHTGDHDSNPTGNPHPFSGMTVHTGATTPSLSASSFASPSHTWIAFGSKVKAVTPSGLQSRTPQHRCHSRSGSNGGGGVAGHGLLHVGGSPRCGTGVSGGGGARLNVPSGGSSSSTTPKPRSLTRTTSWSVAGSGVAQKQERPPKTPRRAPVAINSSGLVLGHARPPFLQCDV